MQTKKRNERMMKCDQKKTTKQCIDNSSESHGKAKIEISLRLARSYCVNPANAIKCQHTARNLD
jgi:hypothetical protein